MISSGPVAPNDSGVETPTAATNAYYIAHYGHGVPRIVIVASKFFLSHNLSRLETNSFDPVCHDPIPLSSSNGGYSEWNGHEKQGVLEALVSLMAAVSRSGHKR